MPAAMRKRKEGAKEPTLMVRMRVKDNRRLAALAALHAMQHVDYLTKLINEAWERMEGRLIDPASTEDCDGH